MKNTFHYFAIILVISVLWSCNSGSKTALPEYNSYTYDDTVHLFDNDSMPAVTIEISVMLPGDSQKFHGLYTAMCQAAFGNLCTADAEPLSLLKAKAAAYAADYTGLEPDINADEFSSEDYHSFDWYYLDSMSVVYANEAYVSFSVFDYAYTGGAHGNYGESFFVYDMHQQKLLSLQDMLGDDHCQELIELQTNWINENNNPDDYWLDGLTCTNSFYLTPDGIHFHYDPYEIGPYAIGPTDITISWDKVKDWVKLPELMTLSDEKRHR